MELSGTMRFVLSIYLSVDVLSQPLPEPEIKLPSKPGVRPSPSGISLTRAFIHVPQSSFDLLVERSEREYEHAKALEPFTFPTLPASVCHHFPKLLNTNLYLSLNPQFL